VSTSADPLEWLNRLPSSEAGIDRQALAGLLVELARNIEPGSCQDVNNVHPIDPRLEQLRSLLLGREIHELSRLSKLVEDPEQLASAVGRVLPTAIAQTSADPRWGTVLAPAVEKAAATSVRHNPRTFTDILHPLILPAIRKSIGETVDETFQSLNESLKYALTWRGLKWRWEAWRTGTSFAEVVLKHTLVYQVEHVFLIHRHSGLLIAHVAAENAASEDPQLVSSMLTAIQDFVRDSFRGAEQQGLDTLKLGELRLWSETGTFATLVAVIRGNPPEELHQMLRNTLSRIHEERSGALEAFDGDISGLSDVEGRLTECVALRQQVQPIKRTGFLWLIAFIVLVPVLAAGLWGYRNWQDERRWEDYVARLRTEPGIVITELGRRNGDFQIAGLRDPLAADPMPLLREAGIDPSRVKAYWQTYQSLDPEFVRQRLQALLDPPVTITLSVDGDTVVAQGSAPSSWITRATAAGRTLPAGAPRFDLSRVRNINEEAEIRGLSDAIQSHEIRFDYNESLPAPGQDTILDELASRLRELVVLSKKLHVTTRVTLTGHSDTTGRGTFNLSLSLARAETVRALLKKRGVDPDLLAVRGAGQLEPEEPETYEAARSANRRVSFTVGFY